MSTDTKPDAAERIRGLRAKLDAIAPLPPAGESPGAVALARHLAVRAQQRRAVQLSGAAGEPDQRELSAMCAEFAAAHALFALAVDDDDGDDPGHAAALCAAQITDAWDDGGGVGEWLYEHLGEESAAVSALAEELAAAQAPATAPAPEPADREKCGAIRHGRVDLRCTEPRGHDKQDGGTPGTWHESVLSDHQEITYDGARHIVHTAEHVSWEPASHFEEAARHILAGREGSA